MSNSLLNGEAVICLTTTLLLDIQKVSIFLDSIDISTINILCL